jgi:DNA-binding XRE family transcriptional regulator
MAFDQNLIRLNREKLGLFFASRRKEMGHTIEDAAAHIGISANTLRRIEAGKFPWDIDLHNKICESYELKPFLVPLEFLKADPYQHPKFLFCPYEGSNTLFILHRDFPQCLIEVIQTMPVSFKIKDIYALSDEEEIVRLGIIEKVKMFFHEHVIKGKKN